MTLRRITGKLLINRLVPLCAEIGEKDPEDVARFYALTLIALKPEMITQDKMLAIIEELLINYTGEKDD